MSQASRWHVRALTRWREQVARFLVEHALPPWTPGAHDREHDHTSWAAVRGHEILCGDRWFDVAAARAAAERELARAEADLVELSVFTDWTRERGRGPENSKPGAHGCTIGVWSIGVVPQMPGEIEFSRHGIALPKTMMSIDGERATVFTNGTEPPAEVEEMLAKACGGVSDPRVGVIVRAHRVRAHGVVPVTVARVDEEPMPGGWPGSLVREYSRKRCPNMCVRLGRVRVHPGDPGPLGAPIKCELCDGGWLPHETRRADIVTAPARARVARRVLDMLDARPGTMWERAKRQPSGCTWCGGVGHVAATRCSHCRGTGHNLRGTLPEVEVTPQQRRRVLDANGSGRPVPDWQVPAAMAATSDPMFLREREDPESGSRLCSDTRVVDRGKHRDREDRAWGFTGLRANVDLPATGERRGDRIRVHGFGVGRWAPRSTHRGRSAIDLYGYMPRWRRGEIRHASKRVERRFGLIAQGGDAQAVASAIGGVQARRPERVMYIEPVDE